jgi:hypothetical protein
MDPAIRIWGEHRESDWDAFWTMDRLLRQKAQLAETLRHCAAKEIDIFPAQRPRAPVSLHDIEVFLPGASTSDTQILCDEIHRLTGRRAQPVAVETDAAFRALASERLLYLRQGFELWDEVLPRFILGVDFDSGRHVRLRPAQPEKWRVVDHTVDGWNADRRVLPALLLEPSEKGARLLAELKKEFDDWYKQDFRGRPPLNAILAYRNVLARYGVDCNESFRYGLADGWFPIDVEQEQDWNAARELCAMPLPDNPGDLLLDDHNKPVDWYGAIFSFVALT